ncbi:MAG: [Fe-Fe] hydrogenase large subunit C-terminal domain-containing protein [Salinivirgaceae bacterium]
MKQLITVDKEKCVNCHQCIAVCPVKFANNGSDEFVTINHELCIGCGECIKACTHSARGYIDDMETVLALLKIQTPTIAIAAPAVASNFDNQALNLNGWLQTLGIDAFFDVSFGAELTVKSYLEYATQQNPRTIIAQPCPAIVTYIETYQPELLKWLAPIDSPMMHTIKMIREFYPEYKDHKIMVVSPCIAKEREFEETTSGVYNVTISKLVEYITDHAIDLSNFPPIDYLNPKAGLAAGFSTPGGLLETVADRMPKLRNKIRKIEGPKLAYEYLKTVEKQVQKGNTPLIIDILNCENGCNGGTGTCMQEAAPDELEAKIADRINTLQKSDEDRELLLQSIDEHWQPNLYDREYTIKTENYAQLRNPNEAELNQIMLDMHKTQPEHILNCAACGYNDCKTMCKAIYNGLNKKENCHFYLQKEMEEIHNNLDKLVKEKTHEANRQKEEIVTLADDLLNFMKHMHTIIEN